MHPADRAQLGIPSTDLIQMAAWRGGTPAHTDFSLVCPPTGRDAVRQMRLIRARVEARGFDYAGGFTLNPRHAIALALVSFDRDDPGRGRRRRRAVPRAHRRRRRRRVRPVPQPRRLHGPHRRPVRRQRLRRSGALPETIKDALDPGGILAPGKQGIWPAGRRA